MYETQPWENALSQLIFRMDFRWKRYLTARKRGRPHAFRTPPPVRVLPPLTQLAARENCKRFVEYAINKSLKTHTFHVIA